MYKVRVNDLNNCEAFSSPYPYLVSNVLDVQDSELKLQIVPKPSDGHFTVRFSEDNSQPFGLRIFDATGKVIAFKDNLVCSGKGYSYSPEQNMAMGVYFIEIKCGEAFHRERILITE
jgi:hypothetical protein